MIKGLKHAFLCVCAAALLAFSAQAEILTYSSGTGFFVSRDGYIITNHHVIEHCNAITVSGPIPLTSAKLVAQDEIFDLALLKTSATVKNEAKLSTDKQPLVPDDPVVVVGYPGQSWKTGQAQMEQAMILSTKGPRGEEKWLEFSDSLAKGNSGGPLFDSSGNVVGVVAAKATMTSFSDREKIERFDIAISLPVLRQFLASNGIEYQEADSGLYLPAGPIAEAAGHFVVNVRCRMR